jgi:L1 cell adhesion molecule like protein
MIQKLLREYFDGKNLCSNVNPEEAVACEAAVQAAILSGDNSGILNDILVLDAALISLGISMDR